MPLPPATPTPQNVKLTGNLDDLVRGANWGIWFGQSSSKGKTKSTIDVDLTGKKLVVYADSPAGVRTEWSSEADPNPFTIEDNDEFVNGEGETETKPNAVAVLDTEDLWSSGLTEEGVYHVTCYIDDSTVGFYYLKVWTPYGGEYGT